MQTQAPRGQYRVMGLDPFDTLTWPSGPLWKDCETLDEARDFADRHSACMRGSTYTTTPATFCTRQASARSSLEGLALTAPIGNELGEDVAAKLPQFGTGFRRKELALAEPW